MGRLSSPKAVLSGVPQGSVLGPLLFLVFINHVASQLSCKHKIFADDLKIYACLTVADGADPVASLQSDVDVLVPGLPLKIL